MASDITPGTLTVTLTEALTLNDAGINDHGVTATNAFTIASVANVVKRVVTIPTTEVGLLAFAATLLVAPGTPQLSYVAGHYVEGNVRYIRITNKSTTDHVTLVFKSGTTEFAVLLDFGQTFHYGCDRTAGTVGTMYANTIAGGVTLTDLDDVTALANTADVDLEVFVASD